VALPVRETVLIVWSLLVILELEVEMVGCVIVLQGFGCSTGAALAVYLILDEMGDPSVEVWVVDSKSGLECRFRAPYFLHLWSSSRDSGFG
jgi:hypothetical protein